MVYPEILLEECPSREESMKTILESLSKEEEALAKLILLESEKIKKFADGLSEKPFSHSPKELLKFIRSTKRISDLIAQKGLFLRQKRQNILLFEEEFLNEEEGEE